MKKLCLTMGLVVILVGCGSVQEDTVIREFTAYGTKAPWRILVDHDTLSVEGNSSVLKAGQLKVERLAYAKGVEFSGDYFGKPLTLNVRFAECKDAQGQASDFTATLYYGKNIYKGCAVAGLVPHANT
ncbi:hypothetical protein [Wohlfahrtiimonas sp. G9077]|uniref:hypothetical protein n=1 Tax=Wohlfahrtiimonas sp. G9077 TaxID=1980118 RepID=UPI000B9957DD|nr:hypothetical protein [Wohlfahrtiimonas sp. G9077]OYQ75648.1 hypothetical protein B9T20_02790 [Wohlfahrtiimonas sp. G9077]